ncbi:MAG: FGGY family carbohydrate kinase, partial [Actinomycetes bacterium]
MSTQSTKVVVVDTDDGRVMASASAPHDVTGSRGARESDPDRWEGGMASCLAQTSLAADVGAISVAAQQHGLVALGADGRPLRPAMLW